MKKYFDKKVMRACYVSADFIYKYYTIKINKLIFIYQ